MKKSKSANNKNKKIKKDLKPKDFFNFFIGIYGEYLDISRYIPIYKGIFNRDVGNKKIEEIFRRRVGKTEPQV